MLTTRPLLLCVFILWGYGDGQHNQVIPGSIGPSRYEAWKTYTTLKECESAQAGWKLPPHYTRAVCLPDTVNPNRK